MGGRERVERAVAQADRALVVDDRLVAAVGQHSQRARLAAPGAAALPAQGDARLPRSVRERIGVVRPIERASEEVGRERVAAFRE
jgi:hypothetical protein